MHFTPLSQLLVFSCCNLYIFYFAIKICSFLLWLSYHLIHFETFSKFLGLCVKHNNAHIQKKES